MSAESRFTSALASIRVRTKTEVQTQLQALSRQFASDAASFSRTYNGAQPLTDKRKKEMLAAIVAILKRLSLAASTAAITSVGSILDDATGEIRSAHTGAARDEGLTIDGLDVRFLALFNQLFARIEKGHGRIKNVPALIAAYQKQAEQSARLLLEHAVANGVSEADAAKAIQELLQSNKIRYGMFSVDEQDMTGLRFFNGAATRIIVSESFNTMRDATQAAMQAGGFLHAAQWELSPSHREIDICDEIALEDVGFGAGVYLVSEWPKPPHPMCACRMGGTLIFKPQSEW
jgi:hypothetical protein